MLRASLRHPSTSRAAASAVPPPLRSTSSSSGSNYRSRRRTMAAAVAAASSSPSDPPPPPALAATTIAPPAIPRREIALSTTPPATSSSTELRVLTWNVLADGLAQHGGWTHLPSPDAPALAWERRFPRLLAEVAASGADVVCLQECNRFADAWLPAMRALGYEGKVWQKPRSPCERYGADKDGLALFWRADRLRLAGEEAGAGAASSSSPSYYSGPYRHLAPSPAALATLEEDEGNAGDGAAAAAAAAPTAGATGGPPLQLEAASQGLIVAVFEDAEAASGAKPPRRLVVAVTHLKAKEGFEARRREQAAQLCERVRGAVVAGAKNGAQKDATAVVVAGDFNAPPDSAAAELVRAPPSEGGLGLRCLWDVPLAAAGGGGGEQGAGGGGGGGGGGNGRKSSSPQQPPQEELLFTTWKFRGDAAGGAREKLETIDHIFFGGAADVQGEEQQQQQQQQPQPAPPPLVPLSRWASPSRSEIGCAALPCDSYPSDHIAVLCRFAWRR